jgi:hypothetical protein
MTNEPDPQSAHDSTTHTHEWDVWKITKEGNITIKESDGWYGWNSEEIIIGTYIDQRRRCKTCGKHELDTQVSYIEK